MRAKFESGEQRKFLQIIRKKTSLTWREIAKICDVTPENARLSYYYEKSTMPLNAVKHLAKKAKINLPRLELLPDNWGREKAKRSNTKLIDADIRSNEFAEFVGIILGDGHISKDQKIVTISAHAIYDLHYIEEYVPMLIKKLFKLNQSFKPKPTKTKELVIYSTQLNRLLADKIGIPRGDKRNNSLVKIPDYIMQNNGLLKHCIRGLFDTDGSTCMDNKGRLQVCFTSSNKSLYDSICEALEKLRFKFSPSKNILIYSNQQVVRFFKEIGTSNLKNAIKIVSFLETGTMKRTKDINLRKYWNSIILPFYVGR